MFRSVKLFCTLSILTVLVMIAVLVYGKQKKCDAVLVDNGQCTTAVMSGRCTANGRPLLWKNRDVSQPDQEIVYFNDGPHSYVTIANAGDSSQAWGGVNNVGFAIEDANNWNTQDTVPGPDDDGTIIKLALRTCAVVSDFAQILDSTTVHGTTQPAIFGVIDASGGASMFETFAHYYVRYDCSDTVDAPQGFMVRSNFSYAGSHSGRIGQYRHDRADSLIKWAVRGDSLTAKFMCRTVMRDLRNENGLNPYPLPYQGVVGVLPRGWVPTTGAICRRLTVSGCVIEGVLPQENPLLATLWAFPMAVQYGVALPFWVSPRSTPVECNGDSTAALCDVGLRIKELAQHKPGFHDTLDTSVLVDGHGGGVYATTFPTEDLIFHRADSALAVWRAAGAPDSAGMRTMSAELATLAYDSLHDWPRAGQLWVTPKNPTGLTICSVPEGIRLRWNAVTQDTLGLQMTPSGYSIWRCDAGNTSRMDSITTVTTTQYVVPLPADSVTGFYRVKAVR